MFEPPANVHVVTSFEKLGIEAIDRLKSLTAERHVAAWDVFGDLVTHQHVNRLAGRSSNARGEPAIVGRQVRPAHRRRSALRQLMYQMNQPVRIGDAVRVGISDDGTCGAVEASIRATLKPR